MSAEALRLRDAGGPLLAGGAAAYLTAVELVRLIRPALLLDPEPSWASARLLLDLAVLAAASSAAGAVAAAVFLWGRSAVAGSPPKALPLLPGALTALAAAGFLGGVLARFVSLDRIPWPLFQDDLTLIAPALELRGSVRDFSNSIRPAPYGVPEPVRQRWGPLSRIVPHGAARRPGEHLVERVRDPWGATGPPSWGQRVGVSKPKRRDAPFRPWTLASA